MQISAGKKLNTKTCSRRTSQYLTKTVSFMAMILHVSVKEGKKNSKRKRMVKTKPKKQNLRLIIVAKAMMVKIIRIVSHSQKSNKSSIMNSSTR